MKKEQLIGEMLLLPVAAIEYHISRHLLQLFPDKALIESDGYLGIQDYAEAKHCTLAYRTFTYNQMNTYWRGPEPQILRPPHMMHSGGFIIEGMNLFPSSTSQTPEEAETHDAVNKAWFEVQWQGNSLDVLILHIQGLGSQIAHFWILGDTPDIARSFLAAVSRWEMEIRGEVLVFDNGQWYKDEYLFQDIKNATFDNLILRGTLKQEIRDDLLQFFSSRDLYEEHDVPWKRGILFVGPAGIGADRRP
jgi:hypothetical protein